MEEDTKNKATPALTALAERIDAEIAAFKESVLQGPNASEFQMHEVWGMDVVSGALMTPFGFVDGAANTVIGWTLNNPAEYGTQSITYVRYLDPQGNLIAEAVGQPDDGAKVDGSASWQTGAQGAVLSTAHELAPPPRHNGAYLGRLPFALVPYGANEPHIAKEGAFVGDGEGPGPGPGVSAAEVQAMLDTAVANINSSTDSWARLVIANMMPKLMALSVQIMDKENYPADGTRNPLPYDALLRRYRDIYWAEQRNRAYEGVVAYHGPRQSGAPAKAFQRPSDTPTPTLIPTQTAEESAILVAMVDAIMHWTPDTEVAQSGDVGWEEMGG